MVTSRTRRARQLHSADEVSFHGLANHDQRTGSHPLRWHHPVDVDLLWLRRSGSGVLIAARAVGEEGRVYGLDMTDDMLEAAQENARRSGIRNVVFLRGDIEAIPLPSGSIDVIISNCVVNLAPDKGAAFAEAHRVLRTGGRLAIADIVVDGNLNGLPLTERQIRAGLSWAACVAGALTTEELRATLEAAGFDNIGISIEDRYSRQRLERTMSPEIT